MRDMTLRTSTAVLLMSHALLGCAEDPAREASTEPEPSVECSDEASCASADPLTDADRPFSLATPRAARWPVVLHHGFNASRSNGWSFYRVVEALERDGNQAFATEVEPFHGVAVRAARLAAQIDSAIERYCRSRGPEQQRCRAAAKVNLVAHSMGGLDARWLISQLGYGDRIATLTTIATPHRGSAIADAALGLVAYDRVNDLVSTLAGFMGTRFTQADLAHNADLRAALESLAEANAEQFARDTPDDARVEYQSWTGVSRLVGGPRSSDGQAELLEACDGKFFGSLARADFLSAKLSVPATVVGHFFDEFQDGMVTVDSAKWGTFRGCFAADHLDQVGQPSRDGAAPYTGFDHRIFYRNLVTDLAERGY